MLAVCSSSTGQSSPLLPCHKSTILASSHFDSSGRFWSHLVLTLADIMLVGGIFWEKWLTVILSKYFSAVLTILQCLFCCIKFIYMVSKDWMYKKKIITCATYTDRERNVGFFDDVENCILIYEYLYREYMNEWCSLLVVSSSFQVQQYCYHKS